METKKEEKTITVHTIEELEKAYREGYRYVGSNAYRRWIEDVLDEETGAIINVPRHEVVVNRGTLVTEEWENITFNMQCKEITEIVLSTQCRAGVLYPGSLGDIWMVKVATGQEKYKILLRVPGVVNAIAAVTDFMELATENSFEIVSLKKFKDCIFIQEKYLTMDEAQRKEVNKDMEVEFEDDSEEKCSKIYYKIVARVTIDNGGIILFTFIVSADSIDEAKVAIASYLAVNEEFNKDLDGSKYTITIKSGDVIGCTHVLSDEFCKAYSKKEEDVE